MPICNWLLEEAMFEENGVMESVQAAIAAQGMKYKVINFRPFGGNTDELLELYAPDECVLTYGSLGLSRRVRTWANWVPGAWCNFDNFECVKYYNYLGKYLLNENYIMLPYGEFRRQKDFLLQTLSQDGTLFVRPSSGDKLFAGTLIKAETYDLDVEKMGFYDVPDESVCVVASPRNIQKEWRLVVVDKQVVAASLYKEIGLVKLREGCPEAVKAFGNEVANVWQPDPAFVLDICETKDGDLRLLELNSFSSSGLYVCDKPAIVEAAAALAVKEWHDHHDK